jgi:hypothetical protein
MTRVDMVKIRIGQYLWVDRRERARGRRTDVWDVVNDEAVPLGRVAWHGPWRQYVFVAHRLALDVGEELIFSHGCLRDIAAFLDRANAAQRADAAERRAKR